MAIDPLRCLLDAVPGPACVHRNGRMVHANEAFLRALGLADVAALEGTAIDDLVEAGDRELMIRRRDGSPSSILEATDVRWRCVDGRTSTMKMSSLHMPFEGEAATVELGQYAAPGNPSASFEPARQLASIGSLAAGVAHEISNPLTYVLANIDCLRGQLRSVATKLPPRVLAEMDEMAAEAAHGAERVARIVHSLRIFSRVEEERRAPIELHPIIEAASALAANEIRHRAQLVQRYQPLPRVEANDARLTLAFFNLLLNAAQAIVEGRAESNRIEIKTWTDQGRAVVEIRDTGCGIAPEHLPRIFDPFFTTKAQGVGTGLGLSMCQGTVSALGGEVTVETTVGVGTAVRVTLPAFAGVAPTTAPATRISSGAGRSGRILVVDDDASICSAIRRTLGRSHHVVTVTSGREAIDRIKDGERFDLILCDLMMPVVTGVEVHDEILRLAPQQAERMVFMSGGAFTPAARDFLRRVPNERFDKPFDGGLLRTLAKEMLDDAPPT